MSASIYPFIHFVATAGSKKIVKCSLREVHFASSEDMIQNVRITQPSSSYSQSCNAVYYRPDCCGRGSGSSSGSSSEGESEGECNSADDVDFVVTYKGGFATN